MLQSILLGEMKIPESPHGYSELKIKLLGNPDTDFIFGPQISFSPGFILIWY